VGYRQSRYGGYLEYPPYLKKVDLLGMASRGVLKIPPPMVDSKYRNVLAIENNLQVTAYNAGIVATNLVPKTWQDFLKPEFKGRKLAVDIQPSEVAALIPVWGLEKTLEFARNIAVQQPIWVRGAARTMPYIATGEIQCFWAPILALSRGRWPKTLRACCSTHWSSPCP
jgi:ABC-type Fe3+ transport system substrate-binding protein